MRMLTYFINRGGRGLSRTRRADARDRRASRRASALDGEPGRDTTPLTSVPYERSISAQEDSYELAPG